MQRLFSTQPELFVTSADLEHSSLQGLDGAEAVLNWIKLEQNMAGIYASKTGRPSYQLLTLLRASCPLLTDDQYSFPRQPNKLTSELRRVSPLLSA